MLAERVDSGWIGMVRLEQTWLGWIPLRTVQVRWQ